VSAGIFGSGVCWVAFRQTRQRFQKQQEQANMQAIDSQKLPFGSSLSQQTAAWNAFETARANAAASAQTARASYNAQA
jgi:hypothetical protein